MNDIIKVLPDSVANQIAAGEVIQRPASVVKELVENAIDAGAASVKIILKDAGRTLIQVIDNGKGMSPTDARLAFERHSTSKIRQAADLFELHTMGFRGEALASICAVAQVDLTTMPHGETLGTHIVISGSEVETQEPCAAAPGSNMMVKNLFFNVPARRKFLKKDSVELSNIIHEFERLALVNPGHDFELIHNDSLLHQLLHGSLKQRIGQLFGKTVERQLIPIEVETSLVRISGFVGLPENARRRNPLQYFFVNGRNMRHPYFHKAVMSCYEQLIAADTQPNYFLNFEVDPSTIDVNIHPTKNEIKFENEQAIWQIIVASVRESLGKFNAVPSIDFDADETTQFLPFNPDAEATHELEFDPTYNPFETKAASKKNSPASSEHGSALNGRIPSHASATDWEVLFGDPVLKSNTTRGSKLNLDSGDFGPDDTPSAPTLAIDVSPVSPDVMQLKDRYILSPAKSGLMVIDQHRAHVAILFERYLELMKNSGNNSQQVFFPEALELTTAQNIILDSVIDDVTSLGFDLSFLGNNSWSINGVPSLMGKLNPKETLLRLIDNVENGTSDKISDITRRVALAMAKSAAIQSGQSLTSAEMESLMSDLFRLSSPSYTPDGLPIVAIIGIDEIAARL